jgi:hypothetical protein
MLLIQFTLFGGGRLLHTICSPQALAELYNIVWLNGHADFITPETTSMGFIDGMDIAIIAGYCII